MLKTKSQLGLLLRGRVTSNIIALAFLQIANYAGPFVILIYLTNVLDIELYSFVALSTSVIQIAVTVLDFGFGLYGVKTISENREDKTIVGQTIGSIFTIKIFIFFIILIVFILSLFFFEKIQSHKLIFLFTLIPIFGQAFQCDWFFLGIEKMKYITFISVFSRLISVLAIYLLVKNNEGYFLVPLATGFAQIVAAFLFILNIYSLGFYVSIPKKCDVIKTYKNSLPFFGSRVLVIAYTNASVLLLGFFSTPAIVSVFSVSEQIYRAFQTVFHPITQAIYPFMVKEKKLTKFLKVSAISFFISIIICLMGYLFSPFFIKLLFDNKFLEIIPILNIFYVAIPIHILSVLSGYPLSAIFGLESIANKSVIAGFLVYFIGIFLLIFTKSMIPTNLAVVSVFTELAVFSFRFYMFYPKIKLKLNDK